MRLLTKTEACLELRLSLSTLNRRIAAGEVPVKKEPRGRRHRVYVILDDDPPENGEAPASALAVAQERIRGLEEQAELMKGQLDQERQRNSELVNQLKAEQGSMARKLRIPWRRLLGRRAAKDGDHATQPRQSSPQRTTSEIAI